MNAARIPWDLEPLFPDRTSGENLAVQLARRLRDAIEAGSLRAGTRLLGSRQLARRLGLGRNTVALAFEQLLAEGYLDARTGAGTFVAEIGTPRHARKPAPPRAQPPRAQSKTALLKHFATATGSGALRPGMPDLAKFPAAAWKRSARRAIEAIGPRELGYGASAGSRALREAVTNHVRQFRGVSADPRNVVVVEGAQAALHLAALVLAAPGDGVVVEDPCYALARAAFEAAELQLYPVNVDDRGIDTRGLPEEARLAYVTPAHQFPLGGTLPVARRLELLAWAKRAGAYLLEDDYDSEFTSKTRPLPALQSLDREERVIYIGSFSKTLAPGIRLGYLIVPAHLGDAFRAARASTSLGAALQLQATVADFIERGHFARHVRRMNAVYERRRALLIETLAAGLPAPFRLGPAQTGLHVALFAPSSFQDVAFAAAHGDERLVTISQLCIERRDCRGFLLGFANGSDGEVARAASRLTERLGGVLG